MSLRRETLLENLALMTPAPAREYIKIRIAGVPVEFATCSSPLAARIQDYFRDFLDPSQSDALHRIHTEPLTPPELSPDLWEDEDPEFDVRGSRVVQRDFAARRLGRDHAMAFVAPELDDAFHNLLRWFLPPLLLSQDAFLLHGAAVVRDGRGYAFFGQSEAGKSTTLGLITESDPQAIPLGDDGILIQIRDGIPTVLSAPLGCGYSRLAPPAVSAPLHGLYALCQGPEHRIASLTPSQGAAKLLASVMCVRFDDEAERRLELAHRFALPRQPGISELRFRKDPGFWPLVLNSPSFAYP